MDGLFGLQFQDLAMLGGMAVAGGGATKDLYGKTPTIPSSVGGMPTANMHAMQCAQQVIANSQFPCENGTVGSPSQPSSASCSPSSSEHNQQMHRLANTTESPLDVVNSMINNAQMKTEPVDSAYNLPSLTGMPMHLNPYHSARSSLDSTQSNATPAPVQSRRSRSSNDGMLKCNFCPKKFTDAAQLHGHMGDCRQVRVHECQQCGKRFKARGGLQQHMRSRIHSNDRPYACQFCAKRFTQKSHVDQHERIHTGAKPFVCQFCGRAFRQRSQQIGHEATHQHGTNRHNHRQVKNVEERRQPQDQSNAQQQQTQQVQQQQPPQQPQQVQQPPQPSPVHQQSQQQTPQLPQVHHQLPDPQNALDTMLHSTLPSMLPTNHGLGVGPSPLNGMVQPSGSPLSSTAALPTPPLNNLFGFPTNCANNAMSSLLALSQDFCLQNMTCPQQPSYGNNMALGIINSIQ